MAHAAILVLLAAPARAWFIAADALATVADRLGLLIPLLAIGNRGILLAADAVAVRTRRGARGGLVRRGADRPQRFQSLFLFHAENGFGDLVLDPFPHGLEFLHALALVSSLGIFLSIATESDGRPQVSHRVQVVLPRG